jgi:hypothetical protein
MKKGFLYVEAMMGIGLFALGTVSIAGFYLTVWRFSQRHEDKERAALLAEEAVISLRTEGRIVRSSDDDLTLTVQEQEGKWVGKLKIRELRVYQKEETEPIYNLFTYE